jgi:hypothetical protein
MLRAALHTISASIARAISCAVAAALPAQLPTFATTPHLHFPRDDDKKQWDIIRTIDTSNNAA